MLCAIFDLSELQNPGPATSPYPCALVDATSTSVRCSCASSSESGDLRRSLERHYLIAKNDGADELLKWSHLVAIAFAAMHRQLAENFRNLPTICSLSAKLLAEHCQQGQPCLW